jgi:hypothetical protein
LCNTVGSLLALRELLEASSWVRQGVLSAAAVDWQRHELLKVTGPDVGLGAKELRAELTSLLNKPLPDPSPAHRRLREVVDHAHGGYLSRWAAAAAQPQEQRPQAERLARVVAAHLLDLGYDARYLAAWIGRLARRRASTEEILQGAIALDAAGPGEFIVLAPLDRVPEREQAQKHQGWLSSREVVDWLKLRGHSPSGLRPAGGFLFKVIARDPFNAASQARDLVERMVARSSFIRGDGGGTIGQGCRCGPFSGHHRLLLATRRADHSRLQTSAGDVRRPRRDAGCLHNQSRPGVSGGGGIECGASADHGQPIPT